MKTLFVVHDAPYPARSGAPLRCWQNINLMAQRGQVYVFSAGLRQDDVDEMPHVERWIHLDARDYPSGRGLVSRLFRQRQFPFGSDADEAENNRKLRKFIDEINPDLIILDHWQEAFPDALKDFPRVVTDAHNIQSVLVRDLMKADGSYASLRHRLRAWRWRQRERDLFRRAWSVWVTSKDDARMLSTLDKSLPEPVVLPNVVDVASYAPVRDRTIALPSGLERNGCTLVYVGFYAWQPNARAALTLIEEIFPAVAERFPEARLFLIGKEPTTAMFDAAARRPRVVITGVVDDVRPYLALADACVIPLTEGGGTRLKILEAFASKVPVVSTAKGAEGLDVRHGEDIVIADDAASMARGVVDLFSRPARRDALTRAAFALVNESYSYATLDRRIDELLRPLY